ncbi:MAG TPA: hypothetical protein VI431_16865, partial [Candidatus Acidoferrum sp.]
MKTMRRVSLVLVGTVVIAFVFLFVGSLAARQGPASSTTKSMVPDNPSEHPAPTQPIPYSHKKHLAFGLECKTCH